MEVGEVGEPGPSQLGHDGVLVLEDRGETEVEQEIGGTWDDVRDSYCESGGRSGRTEEWRTVYRPSLRCKGN